jgi:hypothetical protein
MRTLGKPHSMEHLPLAVGLSVLAHGIVLAMLAGGNQVADPSLVFPEPTLQVLRFSADKVASPNLNAPETFTSLSPSVSFSTEVSTIQSAH